VIEDPDVAERGSPRCGNEGWSALRKWQVIVGALSIPVGQAPLGVYCVRSPGHHGSHYTKPRRYFFGYDWHAWEWND